MKYTYDYCKEIVNKCTTKKEVYTIYKNVYSKIIKKKWYDLLSNLDNVGSRYKRCIYVYIINNEYAYVGLTFNLKTRDKQHRKKGTVYNFCRQNNLILPNPIQLTDYLYYKDAVIKEENYYEKYKSQGFKMLNKIKTGGLGGVVFVKDIDREKCFDLINNVDSISEYINKYHSYYKYAAQNDFFEEIKKEIGMKWKKKICIFDENGYLIEILDKVKDAINKYNAKYLNGVCHNLISSKNHRFLLYDNWVEMGRPQKVDSIEEANIKSHRQTITKRTEKYKKEGNPQTGTKRKFSTRIKFGKPIVMLTLDNQIVDILPNLSFACELYNINKGLLKCAYKVMNNMNKSSYKYRWYTLEQYNKDFNTNLQIDYGKFKNC